MLRTLCCGHFLRTLCWYFCGRYVADIFADIMLWTFFAGVTLVYLWFADILTGICCGRYCGHCGRRYCGYLMRTLLLAFLWVFVVDVVIGFFCGCLLWTFVVDIIRVFYVGIIPGVLRTFVADLRTGCSCCRFRGNPHATCMPPTCHPHATRMPPACHPRGGCLGCGR